MTKFSALVFSFMHLSVGEYPEINFKSLFNAFCFQSVKDFVFQAKWNDEIGNAHCGHLPENCEQFSGNVFLNTK